MDVDFYAVPGPLTELTIEQAKLVRHLDSDPVALCRAVQGLLISPPDAGKAGLAETRLDERNVRPASALMQRVLEIDSTTPLSEPRTATDRLVGTCRHYAALATAFLRAHSIPARGRCGFATYFVPPRIVDHWIVEYWSVEQDRWIRIDAEYVDVDTPAPSRTADLRPGEFLTAGEAWTLLRSGAQDPMNFGVFGTENWGPGEVRGNAMRDLASILCKIEMLPWDEWGPMTDSYHNRTGPEFDVLMDRLADATSNDDESELRRIYDVHLSVPASMVC
jgi:hypothetical protein